MTSENKPRVFVTREIPTAGLDKIIPSCDADVHRGRRPPSRESLLQRVAGCHGILSMLTERMDAEVMEAAGEQLKVISNFAVGYNNIDVEEATRRGIRIGNTPGVLTDATADIALALMLAAARQVVVGQDSIRRGDWYSWEPLGHIGVDLRRKTVGIVGMGRIGFDVARRCHRGWDMNVLYYSRSSNELAEQQLAARRVDFETLLSESDFVSVHTSLTNETTGMFNAAAFQQMKRSAIFINTARGPIHVQSDLYDALSTQSIFAAGLDVTDPEPMAADDPLLSLPNCVVVPHIGSATIETRNAMAEIAADNLLCGLRGEPLRHAVN